MFNPEKDISSEESEAEEEQEQEQEENQPEESDTNEEKELGRGNKEIVKRLEKRLEKIKNFEPSDDVYQDYNKIIELSDREDLYKKVSKSEYRPEEVLAGFKGLKDAWEGILRDPQEFDTEDELSVKGKARKLFYKDVPEAEIGMINRTMNYYIEKFEKNSERNSKIEGNEPGFKRSTSKKETEELSKAKGDKSEFTAETHPEQASVEQLLQEDFKAQGVLEEILRRGDENDLEKLRQRSGLSEEQVERLKYYTEMRDDVVEKTKEEIQDRKEENPKATKKEMQLGAYKEMIEPQVRDAVFKLREKGYNTESSGFDYPGRQLLSFEANDYLEQFDEKEDLREKLKQEGIGLSFSPTTISFKLEGKFDMEKIKETWDKIASKLPDLDEEASKVKHSDAKKFREEQEG